ncbi:MAG: hypothetical protein AAGF20_00380 [Pseudomonadota bacterium]
MFNWRRRNSPQPDFDGVLRLSKLTDRAAVIRAYGRVFDSPDGRIVLAHILMSGGVFAPAPGPERRGVELDQVYQNIERGRRDMALRIYRAAGGVSEDLAASVTSDRITNQGAENE